MSSTKAAADRPRRLPIQVPLHAGESVESFIRRLATANHLRPSYLRTYLNYPPGGVGAIQVTRLALVTCRTVQALTHVFPGIGPDRFGRQPSAAAPPREPSVHAAKRSPATGTGRRDDPELPDMATAIRRHAARDELINRLSRQFAVPRRTIIKALTGQAPHADNRAINHPILEPFVGQIDLLLAADPDASIWSIWKALVNAHHAAVSYATVRDYVNRVRAQAADTRSAKHLMDRTGLFELIRSQAHGDDLIGRLAALLAVNHTTVLQALKDDVPLPVRPTPAPTAGDPQRPRIFTPQLRSHVDAMLAADPKTAIRDIWVRLVNDHQTEVSYATVRAYVARHRLPTSASHSRPRILTARLRPQIDTMITTHPEIAIRDVWERLVDDHDAEVSYHTVREYVARHHRPPTRAPRSRSGSASGKDRIAIRGRSNKTAEPKHDSRAS